jgi:SAM-dependent methyltransferase
MALSRGRRGQRLDRRWLSRQVGASGYVLITDINPSLLAELGELNQPNVEVQRHDIGVDALPEQAFDLIHARLVLVHLPKRDLTLQRMALALKRGGWLVIEDFDATMIDHSFPTPNACAAESYRRMYDAMGRLMTVRGVDLEWGRRLHQRLRAISLIDVGTEGNLSIFRGGSAGSRIMRANFEQIRTEAVSARLVTDEEVERVLAILDDPDFPISSPVMMSAWGRRP